MDAKSSQLKNESKSVPFSAFDDAQESANGTVINVLEVCLMMTIQLELHLKMHFKIYIKMYRKVHQKVKQKGKLQVALELHLFMQLSMDKSVQNDSIKLETERALYVALEGASKISFQVALKTTQKVDGLLVTAIESVHEGTLKLHVSNLHKDT